MKTTEGDAARMQPAILFDLDGTLINSVGVWNMVDEELIARIKAVLRRSTPVEPEKTITLPGLTVSLENYGVTLDGRQLEMPPKEIELLYFLAAHSGKVFTRDELTTIAGLAEEYDAWVVTDEVYEHIVYAPHRHTYISTLPGMRDRVIQCSSLSKTYSITGWRLGYIIASPEIIDTAKKVHDFLTVGAAAPLQEAAVVGLKFPDEYYEELLAKYTAKRNLFLKGLDDIGIRHTEPQGAYYVLLDIREFGYDSDLAFCEKLAEKVGVGAVPGSSFFREPVHNLIRIHFAKKDATLNEALNRLSDIRKKIQPRK